MNEVNFGIIGHGSIAKKHIKLIKKNFPNSKIKILLHKKNIELQNKLKYYYDDKLFFKNKFQFVLICNPSSRHIEYVEKCIKNNIKNIFVEKPISDKFINLQKFINQYSNFKNKILVGYVLLYNNLFLKTLKFIKQKKLGEIISASIVCNSDFRNWRKNKKFYNTVSAKKNLGGGVLNELSHELSYAIELFGPIKNIYSKLFYKKLKNINVETGAKILCITKKKVDLGIFLNFLSNSEQRYCVIVGTKGKLLLDFKNKKIFLNDKKIYESNENKNQMYEDQLKFFTRKYQYKKKIISNKFKNAFETTKIINSIKISKTNQQRVRVN